MAAKTLRGLSSANAFYCSYSINNSRPVLLILFLNQSGTEIKIEMDGDLKTFGQLLQVLPLCRH